jgi:hypothetical protein
MAQPSGAQPFGRIGVDDRCLDRRLPPPVLPLGMKMNKVCVAAAARPAGLPFRLLFAGAAVLAALSCVPQPGHAQGIVRGAQEGSYEGNRIAGPVGGVVGGAVGAGVGGAVGAVEGVFGIPHRGHRRCRGYYDGYNRFHCYR